MCEEVSHTVFPFQAGFSFVCGDFQKLLPLAIGWCEILNVFPKPMCYSGGRVAPRSQHRKVWARMASSHPLQHYPHGIGCWSSSSSTHLVLNYKMATMNDVLSLFLLKKQVTYCLVASQGLCFSGYVWRSQESLAKKRKICLTRLNACPVTRALWLMPTATLLKSQPARDMKEKEHIKAILL